MSARDVIANVLSVPGPMNRAAEADAVLAALHDMPATDRIALARALVPEGWVVAPTKPTAAMMNAAWMHVTTGLETGWDSAMTDLLSAAILASSEETP